MIERDYASPYGAKLAQSGPQNSCSGVASVPCEPTLNDRLSQALGRAEALTAIMGGRLTQMHGQPPGPDQCNKASDSRSLAQNVSLAEELANRCDSLLDLVSRIG